MKKVLLLACMALVLAAPTAMAGVNLNWFECFNAGGVEDLAAPACNSNFGAAYGPMIGSVKPLQAVPNFIGMEAVVDLQNETGVLTDWWDMSAAGCRPTGVSVAFDNAITGPFGCIVGSAGEGDPYLGSASGGAIYNSGFGGPNRARINIVAAVSSTVLPVDPATAPEWYMFKLSFGRANTLACAGCTTPTCIVLNSVLLAQPAGVGDFLEASPADRQHVTWNGGGTTECPGATPTKSSSWGEIKSLYR